MKTNKPYEIEKKKLDEVTGGGSSDTRLGASIGIKTDGYPPYIQLPEMPDRPIFPGPVSEPIPPVGGWNPKNPGNGNGNGLVIIESRDLI